MAPVQRERSVVFGARAADISVKAALGSRPQSGRLMGNSATKPDISTVMGLQVARVELHRLTTMQSPVLLN